MRRNRFSLAALFAVLAMMFAFGGVASTATAQAKKPNKSKVNKQKKNKKAKAKAKKAKAKKKGKKAPKTNASAPYKARGSVGDAYVTGATPGTKLMLVNAKQRIVGTGKADANGAKIFYDKKPGAGYTVRSRKGKKVVQGTKRFAILKPGNNPKPAYYEQFNLMPGLNYVTMRDGVELAMTVRLPMGKTMADGPFPTFIEYSGYQTAAPHDLLNSIISSIGGGGGSNDDLAPASSTAVGSVIGPLLDFATVSVQMRGSGCSGGAFDLFGLPTTYDGYDAVEAVAAQDWVKGHKVGMGGISFSGITQLFTAGTQPPSLAAVSPMSVTDDIYKSTGFPGGIFNKGFAYSWITERMSDAVPSPAGGQTWSKIMTTTGDPDVSDAALRESQKQHCLDNQLLRLQTRDANKQIKDNPFRTPSLFDNRAPGAWAKKIKVPVFWIGQFQDEQTGGRWPEAISNLNGNKKVWISLQNGVHADSLGPSTITRWVEFMKLYVADEVPVIPPLILGLGGELYKFLADAGASPIEQSRFAGYPKTAAGVAQARTEFEKDPRIRVLMDNGAAVMQDNGADHDDPGAIGAKWEADFDSWPIKSSKATSYFLGKGGALSSGKPGAAGSASYVSDPSARPAKTLGENAQGDSWLAQPPYNWQPLAAGKALAWVTPALTKDVFVAGSSSLDLYLKSSKLNTDIQVTLTEVRPDGKETYIQNGWLRASHRKLDKKLSTATNPVPTHLAKDKANLPKGKYSLVRVPIYPAAHVFRAGSKIRVSIEAPGGDRTIWDFDTIEKGKTKNTVGLGGKIASKLVLPVIAGQDAQGTSLPAPTALRGQPSRPYTAASNGG